MLDEPSSHDFRPNFRPNKPATNQGSTFLSTLSITSSSLSSSSPGVLSTRGPSLAAKSTSPPSCTLCFSYLVEPLACGSCTTPPGTGCRRFESVYDGSESPIPVRTSCPPRSLVDCYFDHGVSINFQRYSDLSTYTRDVQGIVRCVG